MKKNVLALVLRSLAAILPLTLAAASAAAQGVTVIADFGQTPTDSFYLGSPLVFDKAGNLYGTTLYGGPANYGTVFELTQKPDGGWARKTLYRFPQGAADGATPSSALVLDAAGNLYGTTSNGGIGYGTVFELSPRGDGSWKETVLRKFAGSPDGANPFGLIFDSAGNLYGTTRNGGAYGGPGLDRGGTIFKLTPQEGSGWKESVIHSFTDSEGQPPYPGGLKMDQAGNLYGTTDHSIPLHSFTGVVFELSPESDGSWSYTTLHTFSGLNAQGNTPNGDGAAADSGVILDADGNLYGTTFYGGVHDEGGAVFEVPAGQGPNGPDKILYSFHSADNGGKYPAGGLVFDASGNLYGTTEYGGPYGGGKIFELLPNGDGTWKIKDLHNFGGFAYNGFPAIDGLNPIASMILGPDGNLYGTTSAGGYYPGCTDAAICTGGTVFRLNLH
jgi:uncharacterized repeat protein (TIGR03803 family)